MRSPIRWFGGKGNMTAKLKPVIDSYRTVCCRYCEPFGGGASVLFALDPPFEVETYNDLDKGLVDFFCVLQDTRMFKKFYRMCQATPYAHLEYNRAREDWCTETDVVKRAHLWFIVARQSFSGLFGASWGSAVTSSKRKMAETASKWLSAIDNLPEVHARLMRVQIENADWRVVLNRYDTPETLFYVDPPYTSASRRAGGYAHELTDEDHVALVDTLLGLRGHAVLSGYPNEIYKPLELAGWRRIEWSTVCYAAGRTRKSNLQGVGTTMKKQPRTEVVWCSPIASNQVNLDLFRENLP